MRLVFAMFLAALSTTAAATTEGPAPAWQASGFVVDELVVTSPRFDGLADLASQRPHVVIERILPELRLDLDNAPLTAQTSRLEELVELHRRQTSRM